MRSTSIATVVHCSRVSSGAAWANDGPVVLDAAYVDARIAFSYMGGKAAELPTRDDSLAGRSVPPAMIALGVQR